MEKKKERKWVAMSEEDKKILDKLAKRYGQSKTAFISLLLNNADYFGIIEKGENGKFSEFEKLRKSVKSFNDSAWANHKEQQKMLAKVIDEMTTISAAIKMSVLERNKRENEESEDKIKMENYVPAFIRAFENIGKKLSSFDGKLEAMQKELNAIKEQGNKKKGFFG